MRFEKLPSLSHSRFTTELDCTPIHIVLVSATSVNKFNCMCEKHACAQTRQWNFLEGGKPTTLSPRRQDEMSIKYTGQYAFTSNGLSGLESFHNEFLSALDLKRQGPQKTLHWDDLATQIPETLFLVVPVEFLFEAVLMWMSQSNC